jgi:hypothetical protein
MAASAVRRRRGSGRLISCGAAAALPQALSTRGVLPPSNRALRPAAIAAAFPPTAAGVFRAVVVANGVQKLSRDAMGPTFSEEDYDNITGLAGEGDLMEQLGASLAPSIHGHTVIKKGLVLLLAGGRERTLANGTHLRGDVNCLMVRFRAREGRGEGPQRGRGKVSCSNKLSVCCVLPSADAGHAFLLSSSSFLPPRAGGRPRCGQVPAAARRHEHCAPQRLHHRPRLLRCGPDRRRHHGCRHRWVAGEAAWEEEGGRHEGHTCMCEGQPPVGLNMGRSASATALLSNAVLSAASRPGCPPPSQASAAWRLAPWCWLTAAWCALTSLTR